MISKLQRLIRAVTPWQKVWFACGGLAIMVVLRWDSLQEPDLTSVAEVSAWIFLIVGFWHSRKLDSHFVRMVHRLDERDALSLSGPELGAAKEKIINRADRGEIIGSFALPVGWTVIGCVWTFVARGESSSWTTVLKLCLEFGAAVFVGGYAGRLVAYGLLGRWLENHGAKIQLRVGHPDGAGGLKVVGDYYFYQASLAILPVIFFGFWWMVAPELRTPFTLGFIVFLIIEFVVFLLPMLFFHREMDHQKEKFNREIDRIGCEVVRLREEEFDSSDPERVEALATRRAALEEQIDFLEALPEWPIDTGIRRRFALSNLAIIAVPAFARVVFDSDEIQNVLERLFT